MQPPYLLHPQPPGAGACAELTDCKDQDTWGWEAGTWPLMVLLLCHPPNLAGSVWILQSKHVRKWL